MQYCYSIIISYILCFLLNCVNVNVGGVNYRASGMLKFDKFLNQTNTASIIWGQLVSVL